MASTFLTVPEVAERLGVSTSIVYALVQARRISCHRIGIGKGKIKFTEAQVAAYVASTLQEAGSLRPETTFTHRRH